MAVEEEVEPQADGRKVWKIISVNSTSEAIHYQVTDNTIKIFDLSGQDLGVITRAFFKNLSAPDNAIKVR